MTSPPGLSSDVDDLIGGGRFSDALDRLMRGRSGRSSPSELLLLAELTQLTGDNREAGKLLGRLEALVVAEPKLQSKYYEVSGAVRADAGDVGGAVHNFERALRAAQETGDRASVCRIQLRMLPNLVELAPPGHLASFATSVRRNVLALGDPQTLALLHLRFAQLEARRGAVDLACRHLQLAWLALEGKPSLWIASLLNLDTSAIRWIVGDFDLAEHHAEQALSLARRAGHARTAAGAIANLCMFAAHRGQNDKARLLATEGIRLAAGFPRVRLALVETAAQVELAVGNVGKCAELLSEVQRWCESQRDTRSWLFLSLLQTKIRLLLLNPRAEGVSTIVEDAVTLADEEDSPFWRGVFKVLQAELLLAGHFLADAHAALIAARKPSATVPLSLTLDIVRVQAQLLVAEGLRDQGISDFGFAARLASCVAAGSSNAALVKAATASLELRLEGRDADSLDHVLPRLERSLQDQETHLAPEPVIAAARLVMVASRPRLLAREVESILQRLGLAQTVRVVAGPTNADARGVGSAENDDWRTIDCGAEDGRSFTVGFQLKRNTLAEFTASAVGQLVANALALERARTQELERKALWPTDTEAEAGDGVFVSAAMRELMALARRLSDSDIPILLTGETGVGKEVYAREIHRRSMFASGTFLPYNCGAVPRDMLDAQLFGHKRGAFTGASEGFQGVIRSANGGTLFLDEVGELALDTQPKLLRFLDRHEVHPLGEAHPVTVNVRVIAATNANLDLMVTEGRFREDLFFRLNPMSIFIPPLRDRREEIPPLVYYYLQRFCSERDKPTLKVSDEAMEYLMLYAWPGNIRQLANEIRRIVALAGASVEVTPVSLSAAILAGRRTGNLTPLAKDGEVPVNLDQPLEAAVESVERAMIDRALKASEGNLERAAERLGISRKGLFLKRKRLGLA